jgi:formate--tetrahydrofolate ligase
MQFTPQTIDGLAEELDIGVDDLELYGRGKAKLSLDLLARPSNGEGRLVLVTAINPTPAGEGKTTVSISLAMGLRRLGKNAVLALREPSLGPVFGAKGGGTGGGKASLTPADDINLHFTGDIHAITTAHNLLSALIDNAIFFREDIPGRGVIDPAQVTWGRALDMNDRALRQSIVGIGAKTDDVSRQEHFDITAASDHRRRPPGFGRNDGGASRRVATKSGANRGGWSRDRALRPLREHRTRLQ